MSAQRECGRLASVKIGSRATFGLVRHDGFVDLGGRSPCRDLQQAVTDGLLRQLVDKGASLAPDVALDDLRYLPPLAAPQKIICIGVNYPDRNEEYKDGQQPAGYPSVFVRFPTSFVGHGENLLRPRASEQLDYEGEVALVVGKAGRHIPRETALGHICAVTLCNEGTIRDWLRHARFNVTQGKNFDRSGSLGPWLAPYEDEAQIADIRLVTRVNGEVRQEDRTSRMIFDFGYLISYLSSFATLLPGDIIVTGTPTGAGARFDPPRWLKPGDVVEVEAEGIGVLSNGIEDEGPSDAFP